MPIREEKVAVVNEIRTKLKESLSTVVTDYRGLTVAEATELRKQLREAGVDFKVYKNTLARRATAEVGMTELDPYLIGPTAIAFSHQDVVAPAKILTEFAKKHEALQIKAGVIEGKVVTPEDLKVIADLPPREGLLSMLLSVMQAPLRNLALAIKAVADQKESQQA
ncbi:ribosomal protein L10 (BL5) [[Clostridium] ultunense Esp]|uniref:50S ribosomal protein L10 n=1 Tax=Thermicanus aegyptius TaxID=94009 RepID=UPI0002B709E2|nr:50S ribosomal protein L10 [Thermicanus aegyptius]CCQ93764.1 ribosomal protein L10 (BL5) [[Clostridium] ultunense Esp]